MTTQPGKALSQGELADFLEKNIDVLSKPEFSLGGWVHNGQTYLDISKMFKNEATAKEVGKILNQISITDLSKIPTDFEHAFINTGGTGDPIAGLTDEKIFEILSHFKD